MGSYYPWWQFCFLHSPRYVEVDILVPQEKNKDNEEEKGKKFFCIFKNKTNCWFKN